MTVQQMLNALSTVQKMMTLKLPIKKAHQVYSLAKQINEQREFFINEEKKLIEKFNATVGEDGRIQFENSEQAMTFQKEHGDLLNYEVEGLAAIELSYDDLGDAEITPADIMLLENVINIVE